MPSIKKKSITKKVHPKGVKAPKKTPQPKSLPKTIVIYAMSGLGKTSLAAHFPRCGFIIGSQEQGIRYIVDAGVVPEPIWIDEYETDSIQSFKKVVDRIHKAAIDPDIDTLVLETVTDFQQMCFLKNCEDAFDGDMSKEGFFSYQQGPVNAATFTWPDFVTALSLVAGAGKNVILTCHCHTKEEQDPQGQKHMQYIPYAHKDIWQRIHKWASGVYLIAPKTQLETEKKKKGMRQIAKPETERILYVDATAFSATKNWYGFKKTAINLGDSGKEGYDNLMKLYRGG